MPPGSENLPRVSFIMPTLNVEGLPDNGLASIARQNHLRKNCSFFKMNLPDGVFPARLVSDSWHEVFQPPPFQNNPPNRDGANDCVKQWPANRYEQSRPD